jgi:hypothetical protein
MSVNLYAAVTAWLANNASAQLHSSGFARIDLDELLGESPPLAATTGLLCVELAVILARQEGPNLDGLMTIPLPGSESLMQDSPTVDEVLAEVWEYGPGRQVPSLYLTEPYHWRRYEDVEEYRKHLPAEDKLPLGYAAYYRVWRTEAEASSGGQYQRAIYIRTADGA